MTASQPIAPEVATAHIPYLWAEPRTPSGQDNPLVAGATIAGGRIRLLLFYGEAAHLQFWQAADTITGQHLAITVVDPEHTMPTADVDAILSRSASLRGIDSPFLATVIDVGRDYCGGVVVAEWIRGATLKEVADTAPSATGVADAVLSLVEAVEAAHRAGLALSIDHPARIRVSVDGRAVLAFPATMPDATPQDDLCGIGAVMYALLVNRWPFKNQAADKDWRSAEVDGHGRIQEPAIVDPRIPFLLSSTAAALVRDRDNIRSAKTITTLLREASAEARNPADQPLTRELLALPAPGHYADFRNFGPAERAQYARRQLVKTCLGTAAVIVLVVLLSFATTINRIVGNFDTDVAMNGDKLGLQPTLPSPQPSLVAAGPEAVKPVKASVFSPGGAPDSPASAGLSVDGDPATAWSTDTYFDPQPFPKFKDGVGLLLELSGPTPLSAVTVDLNSTGTVIQIRSATAIPAKLGDTVELSAPTAVHPGHNVITLTAATPTTLVLVWISTLGSTGGRSHSDISEVTLQTAVPVR
ncbi:protein kinase family protein [Mycobacterium asiaticum]|nr:protein kinase family protein [Mycobacterium asiaticum]